MMARAFLKPRGCSKVVFGAPSHEFRTSTKMNRVIARCKMAKLRTCHHRSPHLHEHYFAAAENVLLYVDALKVEIVTSFEWAPKSIYFVNIEVLFPYAFLPANDVVTREAAVVARSNKKTAMLSQIEHIRYANDADRGFAQTE
jgi:hypothetical protein